MRGRAFLLFAVTGCGLVSGLDQLTVDASTDATIVDSASDADVGDASADVVSEQTPIIDSGGTIGLKCGNNICEAGVACCVPPAGDQLICATSCPSNDLALRCKDPTVCGANQVCCFLGTEATCTSSTQPTCPNPLCTSPQQCPQSLKCTPFDAGYNVSLMRCQ